MWEHKTDKQHGWKYGIIPDNFIVEITGGSIAILDRQTRTVIKRHKGHHYLYTGDISSDERQCFALENGKHFYVYSLENFELIKRVTLPRGYDSIDMYGHYTEDGNFICIPASKWIGNEATGEGYYEYVMCRYDAQQFTLVEKDIIKDSELYRWPIEPPQITMDEGEMASFQRIVDIVDENRNNKDFMDRLLGLKSGDDDPAVAEIMKIIFE